MSPDPEPDSGEQRDPRKRGAGLAAVVVAVTAFSWGFILFKAMSLPMPVISFWRVALGAALLTGAALVLRVPWPEHKRFVIGAGIAFGAHQLVLIGAVKLTSVAIVSFTTLMVSARASLTWRWGISPSR